MGIFLAAGLVAACAPSPEMNQALSIANLLGKLVSDPTGESRRPADAPPSGDIVAIHTPTPTPTPPYVLDHYVVQPGDTLWGIAMRFNIPVSVLQEVNELEDPNHLALGQRLLISERVTISGALLPTATPTPIPCYDGCPYPEPPCEIKGVIARLDGARMYVMPGDEIYALAVAEVWFCREEDAQRLGWLRWPP